MAAAECRDAGSRVWALTYPPASTGKTTARPTLGRAQRLPRGQGGPDAPNGARRRPSGEGGSPGSTLQAWPKVPLRAGVNYVKGPKCRVTSGRRSPDQHADPSASRPARHIGRWLRAARPATSNTLRPLRLRVGGSPDPAAPVKARLLRAHRTGSSVTQAPCRAAASRKGADPASASNRVPGGSPELARWEPPPRLAAGTSKQPTAYLVLEEPAPPRAARAA